MPIKGSDSPSLHEIDRWDEGVGWLAYPEEELRRASHAVVDDGDVWVLDPLDAPGLDDLLGEFGEVAGVVLCLARHKRDAAAVARRHDVPVYVPEWMTGVADELDAPIERFGDGLGDTGYRTVTVRNGSVPPWQEVALFDGETLYVPEAVGTIPFFTAGDERLGVHPMLRLTPPRRALRGLDPDRLIVGHGEGVFGGANTVLRTALDTARSGAPRAYLGALREVLG